MARYDRVRPPGASNPPAQRETPTFSYQRGLSAGRYSGRDAPSAKPVVRRPTPRGTMNQGRSEKGMNYRGRKVVD